MSADLDADVQTNRVRGRNPSIARIEYEFGTDVGARYTQLKDWGIDPVAKEALLETANEPGFTQRLQKLLEEDLAQPSNNKRPVMAELCYEITDGE